MKRISIGEEGPLVFSGLQSGLVALGNKQCAYNIVFNGFLLVY